MNSEYENAGWLERILKYMDNTNPIPIKIHEALDLDKLSFEEYLDILEENDWIILQHGWAGEKKFVRVTNKGKKVYNDKLLTKKIDNSAIESSNYDSLRKSNLEAQLKEQYQILHENETKTQFSSEPKEIARCDKEIERINKIILKIRNKLLNLE